LEKGFFYFTEKNFMVERHFFINSNKKTGVGALQQTKYNQICAALQSFEDVTSTYKKQK